MTKYARAGEMILPLRSLVQKALADTQSTRFLYDNKQWHLEDNDMIARDQVVMSGTPEGVIFVPPTMK
jgi:hypothetical protein